MSRLVSPAELSRDTLVEIVSKVQGRLYLDMEESHRVDEIRLPFFGITIRLAGGKACGSISSDLKTSARDDGGGLFPAAIDGLESLILAHACAGVDV